MSSRIYRLTGSVLFREAIRHGRQSAKQLATAQRLCLLNLQPQLAQGVPASIRCCNSRNLSVPIAEYQEIKQLPNHPEKLLIDVREPDELKETGQIPTSINIPLGYVSEQLAPISDAKQFKTKHGRNKPDAATPLIFHCRSGKRSLQASEAARFLGYKNVKNYEGSWLDWAEKEQLPK